MSVCVFARCQQGMMTRAVDTYIKHLNTQLVQQGELNGKTWPEDKFYLHRVMVRNYAQVFYQVYTCHCYQSLRLIDFVPI